MPKENVSLLSNEFLKKYKNTQPNWGFNGLGYIVSKRTYNRPVLDENGKLIRTEQWWETVKRCVEGAQEIGADYTGDEIEKIFDYVFNLKCSFAGRGLWQLGTSTVKKFGANSLINCFYVSITQMEDFCFIFENLMLGAGVGYSVRREHIHELPRIKEDVIITHQATKDASFIVPDSREGWVELLRKTLQSFFLTGTSFTYSTILVRGYGESIKGFGGTASGPKILIEGIENICKVLVSRQHKKLRSVDVLDVCNIIGSIVVSGNVRRSSQISLGDADDHLFLRAKRWDLGGIPNWRGMSNNTIVADDFDYLSDSLWDGYAGNGEPYGLFNLPLTQEYGRLKEKRADKACGVNPCSEISLESHESCNLGELYLNNIESKAELIECAKLLYKTQKAICSLPYIHKETSEVVHRNFRLGLGVTGICQSQKKLDWLDDCYKELRKFDKIWSKEKGWPESIKITTIKPSGSLSLLAGATPGIHPAYAKYYIRRVRMSTSDPLVSLCKEHGYHIEHVINFDGTENRGTSIVEFPCKSDDNAILAKDMTALQQLEMVKKLQTIWADNSVSVTVYYKKDELEAIKEWLKENYSSSIKAVSFLLHNEHGFKQAPYEEITEEIYNERAKAIKPFKKDELLEETKNELIDSMECSSGACPVK